MRILAHYPPSGPEEFVVSRNIRRRHLSAGQKAAIALEWSEQIELSADPEKNTQRVHGASRQEDGVSGLRHEVDEVVGHRPVRECTSQIA